MKKIIALFLLLLAFIPAPPAHGTVSTSAARNDYAANGSTAAFAYTFRVVDKTHLEVIDVDASGVETVKTVDTDYTVDGLRASGGGNVTFLAAPVFAVFAFKKITMPVAYAPSAGVRLHA